MCHICSLRGYRVGRTKPDFTFCNHRPKHRTQSQINKSVAISAATAIVSAIIGMGGGILLLGALVSFLSPVVAMPLHGVIQIASNGPRVLVLRKHVQIRIAAAFAALVLPGALLGYVALTSVSETTTRFGLGLFILVAVWVHPPTPRKTRSASRRLTLLGGAAGVANTSFGNSGPLIVPFFLDLGLTRHQAIGTKAVCQMQGHIAKIIVFGVAGFACGPNARRCSF